MPLPDPLMGLAVSRASAAEQVADAIREQLIKGEIQPGTRLPDQSIAASLRVSRNTVREAMTILAAQGLVTKELHRGVVVAELGLAELADVYQARRALELAGLRAGKASPGEWLTNMRGALQGISDAVSAEDTQALLDADTEFHRALVSAVGSTRINQTYRNLQTELRLTSAWFGERESGSRFYRRHKRIVTAIDAHDFDQAEMLVVELIDAGEARLRHHFLRPEA